MAVKKKGSKWHPVGKNGNLWKTGYPTEVKAKKALTQANKYFASMKPKGKSKKRKSGSKSSKKKKTTKRKASPKKKPSGGGRTTKKRSWIGYVRLAAYIAAAGQRAAAIIGVHGFTKEAGAMIVQNYGMVDHRSGKPSMEIATITYGPLGAVAAVDTIASKAGVYKRMGSL